MLNNNEDNLYDVLYDDTVVVFNFISVF